MVALPRLAVSLCNLGYPGMVAPPSAQIGPSVAGRVQLVPHQPTGPLPRTGRVHHTQQVTRQLTHQRSRINHYPLRSTISLLPNAVIQPSLSRTTMTLNESLLNNSDLAPL